MAKSWNEAPVSEIIDHNSSVKSFFFDRGELTFEPGQFLVLELPIAEKRTQRWRSYSIASAPQDDRIELCIQKVPGGAASNYFWEELKVDDVIKFKKPQGSFTLPKDLSKEIIMVCTGTGVAPFRSMIQDVVNQRKDVNKINLIFGCRYEEDILYRSEFESYENAGLSFEYDIVLSRDDQWPGIRGYVHGVYLEKYTTPTSDRLFMLCGWSGMIDEAVDKLTSNLGYPSSQILYELYG